MGSFYVTTPIYYVNDVPHLGTAYTTIIADALRRFHLLLGDDTYMLTGTDEHGLKIERQAKEVGLPPKVFTDQISERFREAWPKLEIQADRFIRTTDADHEAFVSELWKKIAGVGDLYKGSYEGWYCVGCEELKTEKELLQPGNLCAIHKTPVERMKEETYFFKLEKYQGRLLEFYAKHPNFIQPETRRNEVLSFVNGGLKDLSVSRTSFSWGIPVPGDPKHVMYVWFDALTNYRSALGHGELQKYWSPNAKVVHLVGKDILRFHAVFWPAFLMAAGYTDSEIPDVVFAHGFLTIDGEKMSKSLRNAVDPLKIASELGADVLRYHLLRAISFGQDGDFDHAAILERYNADLGKNLGNLLNRTLGLCAKMTAGKAPKIGERSPLDNQLEANVSATLDAVRQGWELLEPHRALEGTMAICSFANKYVDESAPWARAKDDPARVPTILGMLLSVLRAVSVLIWPAMPKKSDEMRAQIGLAPLSPKIGSDFWPSTLEPVPEGTPLDVGKPLFPTLDADQQKAVLEKLVPKKETPADAVAQIAEIPQKQADSAPAAPITYDQFSTVELKVGLVKTCERVPKKDKLLKLAVDVGEPEPRTIVAGLALSFTPENLVGRKVVVVANLAPRDFGKGLVSHGMLLATGPSEKLILATVDGDAAPGSRLK
jgi:methionyl-tRNA synthetase